MWVSVLQLDLWNSHERLDMETHSSNPREMGGRGQRIAPKPGGPDSLEWQQGRRGEQVPKLFSGLLMCMNIHACTHVHGTYTNQNIFLLKLVCALTMCQVLI